MEAFQFGKYGILRVFALLGARQAFKRPFFVSVKRSANVFIRDFCFLICKLFYDFHFFTPQFGAPPVDPNSEISYTAEQYKTLRRPRRLRSAKLAGFERTTPHHFFNLVSACKRERGGKDAKIFVFYLMRIKGIAEAALTFKQNFYLLL